MNGIEKRIDNLGRIVLPMSFRKKLGLKKQDIVVVSLKESTISIVPFLIIPTRLPPAIPLRQGPDAAFRSPAAGPDFQY